MSHISLRQLKTQAKKFGFQQVEEDALELVNDTHQKLIRKLLSKKQRGGNRVSMPLEYFSGTPSGNYSDNNTFTNVSATNSVIRPSIPLNDPSSVLGTSKAFAPFVGGGRPKFEVSDKSIKESIKQLQEERQEQNSHRKQQQELTKHAKTKFETLMTDVLSKVSNKANSSTLYKSDLRKELSLKKYQVQLA